MDENGLGQQRVSDVYPTLDYLSLRSKQNEMMAQQQKERGDAAAAAGDRATALKCYNEGLNFIPNNPPLKSAIDDLALKRKLQRTPKAARNLQDVVVERAIGQDRGIAFDERYPLLPSSSNEDDSRERRRRKKKRKKKNRKRKRRRRHDSSDEDDAAAESPRDKRVKI